MFDRSRSRSRHVRSGARSLRFAAFAAFAAVPALSLGLASASVVDGAVPAGAIVMAAAPSASAQALPPDQLVRSVSDEVLQQIRSDRELQAGNPRRISEVIEGKLLPHFDFTRMTALAMGRNWPRATPEQQKALTDQFRTLLVRTYSGALNTYRDYQIDVKPLRMNPGDTDVVVRTAASRAGGQPVPIDYSMEKTDAGWKAYDVIVGGVSLVTNYREEFANLVREGGVDGLIRALADKNRGTAKA
jgi:phospholipid transport system substrate-binding protein